MSAFSRRPPDDEIDEELKAHVRLRADDLMNQGIDAETAERRARIEFGGELKFREDARAAASSGWLEGLSQDVRFSVRMLLKSPGFAVTAVLTLALGIGANTVVFGLVDAILLRPLAFDRPEQLVKVWGAIPKQDIPQNWISEPEFWDLRDGITSFAALAAYSTGSGANLSRGDSEPVRVTISQASAELLPILGVRPLMGRLFSAEEDRPGPGHVAVLDFGFWKSQMAADPSIVGRDIRLNGEPYAVIGVLPEGFTFGGDTNMWVPLALDRAKPNNRGSHYLEVVARLGPGVPIERASTDLENAARKMATDFPQQYPADSGFTVYARPLQADLVGSARVGLMVLFVAVGFVLLIACINLANLLLARGSSRSREIAVRSALGATRARLTRQLMTESVVLAAIGGGCGMLLAWWGTDALRNSAAVALPQTRPIAIDARVLLFSAAISLVTGVVFGIAPALRAADARAYDPLKDSARGSSTGSGHRLRSVLVVAEIALAVVLLVGAGLTARSLQRILEVNPGFQVERVLTSRISLPESQYADIPVATAFFTRLEEQVRALPAVESAGLTTLLPMTGRNSSGSTLIDQTSVTGLLGGPPFQKPYIEADQRIVTTAFFQSMQIKLLRGRLFTPDDTVDTPQVAIVDEEFASHIWADRDPIGQRVAVNTIPKSNPPALQWRTVVGIVAHVKNNSLDQLGREQIYFPIGQSYFAVRNMFLTVRTSGAPSALAPAIQRVVRDLDPGLPVYEVKPMSDWFDATVSPRRFNVMLLVAFGALALALAAIGTYGVMAYQVSQRTQEIGIRLALGATPVNVRQMVVGTSVRLALAGVAIGVALAMVTARFISSLLFGIQPTDPATLGVVAIVLVATAAVAAWVPARRATAVDPMIALRAE
jgi:predicted permease